MSCVRGRDFLAILPSHATSASRSPRARLAFASVPLKYAKNYACSAGYSQRIKCLTELPLCHFTSAFSRQNSVKENTLRLHLIQELSSSSSSSSKYYCNSTLSGNKHACASFQEFLFNTGSHGDSLVNCIERLEEYDIVSNLIEQF